VIAAHLSSPADFGAWREMARHLCAAGVEPANVVWTIAGEKTSLFGDQAQTKETGERRGVVASPRFLEAAERVVCHRDGERFERLYRILWRLQDNPRLLSNAIDSDVLWLRDREHAIRRDEHKMHAFVRFRKAGERDGRERYAAWFEPLHRIVELNAGFFVRRFTGMDWMICTPDCSAFWMDGKLSFGEGGSRADVPTEDAVEDQWRTYFSSTFNPARLKVKSMKQHMPVRYWRNLPEASQISALIAESAARSEEMQAASATLRNPLAEKVRPHPLELSDQPTLPEMREAVDRCRRCALHAHATQGVAGEGPHHASIMIVGEQPGDHEDLAGRPFVGPAGKLLDRALEEAGIDRQQLFITNAIKHFKFEQRGKRRIHSRPNAGEIDTCRWWLNIERAQVKPRLIIGMGASAARSLLGAAASIATLRGLDHAVDGSVIRITVHPSYLLRLPEKDRQAREYARFVEDLREAAARLSPVACGK
jgi:probable DNA metabolism protein